MCVCGNVLGVFCISELVCVQDSGTDAINATRKGQSESFTGLSFFLILCRCNRYFFASQVRYTLSDCIFIEFASNALLFQLQRRSRNQIRCWPILSPA